MRKTHLRFEKGFVVTDVRTPVVPNGPTAANAPTTDENPQSEIRNPPTKGGRRPYDELLEENKAQATRIEELRTAVMPLALLPDDGAKADADCLYTLTRNSGSAKILCGDIRRARRAIGMP